MKDFPVGLLKDLLNEINHRGACKKTELYIAVIKKKYKDRLGFAMKECMWFSEENMWIAKEIALHCDSFTQQDLTEAWIRIKGPRPEAKQFLIEIAATRHQRWINSLWTDIGYMDEHTQRVLLENTKRLSERAAKMALDVLSNKQRSSSSIKKGVRVNFLMKCLASRAVPSKDLANCLPNLEEDLQETLFWELDEAAISDLTILRVLSQERYIPESLLEAIIEYVKMREDRWAESIWDVHTECAAERWRAILSRVISMGARVSVDHIRDAITFEKNRKIPNKEICIILRNLALKQGMSLHDLLEE